MSQKKASKTPILDYYSISYTAIIVIRKLKNSHQKNC